LKKSNWESDVKTTDYDDSHSRSFYDRTINADIADIYERFFNYLPEKATLLDAGCGVGRDTKHFLSKGRAVSAFDASQKMVELACRETGGGMSCTPHSRN
jgi:2-polyprenyl-3-methyl-5-hydroxy-6-metoxy-1,4-benzoquinol methylase